MLMRSIIALSFALLCATLAQAHHNAASHYQLNKSLVVQGVVTEFRLVNPHAIVRFDVKAQNGEVHHWIAEGNSVGVLMRVGWKADSLKAGDVIKVDGRPSRDGSDLILWTTITKSDGTVLYGANSTPVFSDEGVPEATRNHLEELRKRQIEERKQDAASKATRPAPESTAPRP